MRNQLSMRSQTINEEPSVNEEPTINEESTKATGLETYYECDAETLAALLSDEDVLDI